MISADRMAEIRRQHRPCLCPAHAAVTDLLAALDWLEGAMAEAWHDENVPSYVCANLDQAASDVGLDIVGRSA